MLWSFLEVFLLFVGIGLVLIFNQHLVLNDFKHLLLLSLVQQHLLLRLHLLLNLNLLQLLDHILDCILNRRWWHLHLSHFLLRLRLRFRNEWFDIDFHNWIVHVVRSMTLRWRLLI